MNPPTSQSSMFGYIPVEYIPPTLELVQDMTEEERKSFFQKMGKKHLIRYENNKEKWCSFDECSKKDYCKLGREKKEEEKLLIISQQNTKINELQAIIVQHNELLGQIVAKLNTPV